MCKSISQAQLYSFINCEKNSHQQLKAKGKQVYPSHTRILQPAMFSAWMQAGKCLVIIGPCTRLPKSLCSMLAVSPPASFILTHSSSKMHLKQNSVSTPGQRDAAAYLYTFIVTNQKSHFQKIQKHWIRKGWCVECLFKCVIEKNLLKILFYIFL